MTDPRLEHVLWLGGSPCSGKSSVSELLAAQYGLSLYHVDSAYPEHARRLDPARHPAMAQWEGATWEERWMQPVDDLLRQAIAIYREHLGFVLHDVAAMPRDQRILVEGTALLPPDMGHLTIASHRAVWLAPTPEFQYAHYHPARRPWMRQVLEECSDSDAAYGNWMARDIRFARWVIDQAGALGYKVIVVDGDLTADATARQAAAHLGLIAPDADRAPEGGA